MVNKDYDNDQKHEIVKFASALYCLTLQLISSDILVIVNLFYHTLSYTYTACRHCD